MHIYTVKPPNKSQKQRHIFGGIIFDVLLKLCPEKKKKKKIRKKRQERGGQGESEVGSSSE